MFVIRSLSFHLYPCSFLRPIGTPFSARSLLFARFHHSTYVCFAPDTIAASLCLCKTARPVSARTACPSARATRAFFAPIGRYADPLWGWICAWWRGTRQGRASTGRVSETLRYERSGSLKILGIFRSRYTTLTNNIPIPRPCKQVIHAMLLWFFKRCAINRMIFAFNRSNVYKGIVISTGIVRSIWNTILLVTSIIKWKMGTTWKRNLNELHTLVAKWISRVA